MPNDQLWKRFFRPALVLAVALPLVVVPMLALAVVQALPRPVSIDGSINSDTENIAFSGQMTITPRIIEDTVFSGPTILELIIDFSNVKGQGKSSGKKFLTDAQTIVRRPLLAFDQVEATFPYATGNDVQSAGTAKALISVSFNASTGFTITSKITKVF